MKMLTTKQASEALGFKNESRVRQMILAGEIKANKFGRDWIIPAQEIVRIKNRRRRLAKE